MHILKEILRVLTTLSYVYPNLVGSIKCLVTSKAGKDSAWIDFSVILHSW